MSVNSDLDNIQRKLREVATKVLEATSIANPQINLYEEWVKAGKPMLDSKAVEKVYNEGIDSAVLFHKCLNKEKD